MSPEVDASHMRRAIALASARLGLTGKNPAVGCVIVKDGKIIGEAATGEGGRPHAEELALVVAGSRAKGATAFVTLEPCGKRSGGGLSCARHLADAGVSSVVIACEDPSIFAAGLGETILEAHGIEVRKGFLGVEAAHLYGAYSPSV